MAFEALEGHRGLPEARMAGATMEETSSKAPPAVAKSTPTTDKLGAFYSAECVDELGQLYPENVEICGKTWPALHIVGSIR